MCSTSGKGMGVGPPSGMPVHPSMPDSAWICVSEQGLPASGPLLPKAVMSQTTAPARAPAGPQASGAVLASDGFFPFEDTVRLAASHGITAVIQPGGSVRDGDSIAACNALGLAMVVTGRRHFLH
jgi:hypothetical protein